VHVTAIGFSLWILRVDVFGLPSGKRS